jgi:uncharacterized repeat protein (TIGR01451 family)
LLLKSELSITSDVKSAERRCIFRFSIPAKLRKRRAFVFFPGLVATLILGCCTIALGQAPVIDSFTPTAGSPGDIIQVSGSGFSRGGITVYFWNGVPASYAVTSDSQLTAIVPSGTATGALGISQNGSTPIYTSTDFLAIGPGPYISDFSPAFAGSNDLVVINGVHLVGVAPNGVSFNGVSSRDASPNANGTQINVHVPYGTPTGSGPIRVTASTGTSNSPTAFLVIGPGPYITDFSPDHGTAGTTVFIDGEHFTGASGASFNGLAGSNFVVQSDTLIRVDAPPGVTTGPLSVSTAFGNSTTSSNFFVPPTITGLSPATGRTGTNVTISGTNLRGATNVTIHGMTAGFTIVNNTTIQATVPTGATTGQIRVNTPYFSAFSVNNFTVQPTIYGFTPNFGPAGTSVTITGANLNVGTPVVKFNGVQAAAPTGVTFGQLTAVVPAGATTGLISVTTSDGSHTNANNFYLPASISSFTPNNSAPGSTVRITGQNFLGTLPLGVTFNGAPAASFTVSNNTTIGAIVPVAVSTGPLTVTTPAGSATTTAALFYGPPLITSFSPTNGAAGTNVTIGGTNFLGATAVRFNGLSAGINSINNSQIVAVAPVGVQTGPITVEAPGGTNTTANDFVLNTPSDLEVWITDAPDPVMATSNLVYSVTLVNHGPFDATNVRLTNTLPSSVNFISASMPAPWTVVNTSNLVVASIASAPVGSSSTLTVTVAPQTPGTIVDSATISSSLPDPMPANNSYAITTYVLPLPVLSIRWWTNQVKVSWSTALTNYILQSNPSLTNSTWSTDTNVPVVSGNQKFVIESNTPPSKFYRLKQ